MEERQLKRLLIIVAVSIAIIMGFKMMLTDSLTTMHQAAAKKKLATPAPPQPTIEPPVMLERCSSRQNPLQPNSRNLPCLTLMQRWEINLRQRAVEITRMDAPASSNVSSGQ